MEDPPAAVMAQAPLSPEQSRHRLAQALQRRDAGDPRPLVLLLRAHHRLDLPAGALQKALAPGGPALPEHLLHPSLLPADLLADAQHWDPGSAGVDPMGLLAAHPQLNAPEQLLTSGLLQRILTGEAPLYPDLPPLAIEVYASQLRKPEQERCQQEEISALAHLARHGRQAFRAGVALSRCLDRFLPLRPDPPPRSPGLGRPQLLVVLEGDPASSHRLAARGGWGEVLAVEAHGLAPLARWLADADPSALVSFCHVSDRLDPQAALRMAAAAEQQPEAALMSSDEALCWALEAAVPAANRQNRVAPTPLRLLCRGAIGGLVTVPAGVLAGLELPGSCRSLHALVLDLALQLAGRGERFGHCGEVLLQRQLDRNPSIPDVATPRDRGAFTELQQQEIAAVAQRRATPLLAPGGRLEPHPQLRGCQRLRYATPAGTLISILIPFRDQPDLTQACVASIRRHAGAVPYELVLIDNGSSDPAIATWLRQQDGEEDVTVLRLDVPFNYARLHNLARPHCRGSHLLLLNNDIEFASDDVLAQLLHPFALRDTRAVGARLHYPDGSIQHQGVALVRGEARAVMEPGKRLREQAAIDMLTPLCVQEEFSAASAACLLLRTQDYDAIQGFNEAFSVTLNDIDLCLRLRQNGGSIVVTPEPRLIHHESVSRGRTRKLGGAAIARSQREQGLLRSLHAQTFAAGDALLSPHLDLLASDYAEKPREEACPRRVREALVHAWRRPGFRARSSRPLLIFAQFAADGRLRDDIPPLLKAYSRHADVVFVGATPQLKRRSFALWRLQRHCKIVLIRHNEGYDFGSWMTALRFCAEDIARSGCALILTNDSFFGPVRPLKPLFDRIASCRADMIGLSRNVMYEPHLQSPFMVYRPAVISSPEFQSFWDELPVYATKKELIKQCEVGLPARLMKAGFAAAGLYIQNGHGNDFHFYWRELIEAQGFPFIKVSLLRENRTRQDISDWPSCVARSNPSLARQMRRQVVAWQRHRKGRG